MQMPDFEESLTSPKCLYDHRTCAVSSDGPEAAQHTNYIAIHCSSNLGNRGPHHTFLHLWLCLHVCECAEPTCPSAIEPTAPAV